MKDIRKFRLSRKAFMIVASGLVLTSIAVIAIGSFEAPRNMRRSDVKPNGTPPATGISLVFNPPLKDTATLEIDGSDEKILKTVSLGLASPQDSMHSINNPLGIKYNIPLNEGVYRIKVTSSKDDFPPFVSTATVTNNQLTTENVGFSR